MTEPYFLNFLTFNMGGQHYQKNWTDKVLNEWKEIFRGKENEIWFICSQEENGVSHFINMIKQILPERSYKCSHEHTTSLGIFCVHLAVFIPNTLGYIPKHITNLNHQATNRWPARLIWHKSSIIFNINDQFLVAGCHLPFYKTNEEKSKYRDIAIDKIIGEANNVNLPIFIFGDLNFRTTDKGIIYTEGLFQDFTSGLAPTCKTNPKTKSDCINVYNNNPKAVDKPDDCYDWGVKNEDDLPTPGDESTTPSPASSFSTNSTNSTQNSPASSPLKTRSSLASSSSTKSHSKNNSYSMYSPLIPKSKPNSTNNTPHPELRTPSICDRVLLYENPVSKTFSSKVNQIEDAKPILIDPVPQSDHNAVYVRLQIGGIGGKNGGIGECMYIKTSERVILGKRNAIVYKNARGRGKYVKDCKGSYITLSKALKALKTLKT